MEIEVWSVGKAKFTADPEFQEPVIREAIDQRGDVADVITDYADRGPGRTAARWRFGARGTRRAGRADGTRGNPGSPRRGLR
jgi:hypothetical protein